jgi:pSer/pThr/pTyr-binding forkhead associated (FHA) protein
VITIGRASCDLNFPSDGFVSARHAELSLAGETAFLRDLGSANGTFVRVPSRTERVLSHGDYLMMGRELLRVELAANAA